MLQRNWRIGHPALLVESDVIASSAMRATRDVLVEAFRFVGRHLRLLFTTAGLLLVPLAVVKALAGPLSQLSPDQLRDGWSGDVGSVVLVIVELATGLVTFGVLTLAVAHLMDGKPVSWKEIWATGLGRTRKVLTMALALLLPIAGWAIAIVFPIHAAARLLGEGTRAGDTLKWLGMAVFLIFLSVRTAFVWCVATVENVGGWAGYRRNLRLVSGRFWRLIGPVGLTTLLFMLVSDGLEKLLPAPLGEAAGTLWQWLLAPLEVAVAVILYRRFRAEETAIQDAEALAAEGKLGQA